MTENINDHKTYSLTFRFSSGEIIYEDEYTVYFSSKDLRNNINKQRYNKYVINIFYDVIYDYYVEQYDSLETEEKNKIEIYFYSLSDDEIDKDYDIDELAKQYIDLDSEIYNVYDSDYFNELRKLYIDYIVVFVDVDLYEHMIKTHTSYIFDNKSFPSTYSLYNYIFKNNDKLTETNYDITVVTSIIYE